MIKLIEVIFNGFFWIINSLIYLINYVLPENHKIKYLHLKMDTSYLYKLEDLEKYKKH